MTLLFSCSSSQNIYEEVTDLVHVGSYKQVSPLFTLYRTSPYNLRSHVIDPVYKGGPKLCAQVTPPPKSTFESCEDEGAVQSEGAEGGEEWSLECLRTTLTGDSIDYLSPSALRETFNSSRTGLCEDRPLSMTDFGDSLFEYEQAEQDFKELSMELTKPDEASEKGSATQQSTSEQLALPTSGFTVRTECTRSKQTATLSVDEVSHRLYKGLYLNGVESMDSEAQDLSVIAESSPLQAVRKDEVQATHSLTKGSIELEKGHFHSVDFVSSIPRVEYGFEKAKSLRAPSLPKYESMPGIISGLQSSHECSPDTVILLSESKASSPESVSSVNELNLLSPDSPVPQFRPLSPLPPPLLSWELGEDGTAAPRSNHALLLLTSDTEEGPLRPMVSNKRPIGSAVSPVSVYSGEQSMSPHSLTFNMEDRASSPESIIAETVYSLFEPDHYGFHKFSSLSPPSLSPVQHFRHSPCEPFQYEGMPSSPESENWPDPVFLSRAHCSRLFGPGTETSSMSSVLFHHEEQALSPSLVTSGDESVSAELSEMHTASSTKSTNATLASKTDDHLLKSLLCDAQKNQQTLTKLQCENEDDWFISLHNVEERSVSSDSVYEYRPMSPQSTLLDIRRHSPESDTVDECLYPDSPIPQYMSFTHHAVLGNYYASSTESVLSDVKYEAMPLLSCFDDRPLSPDSCGSETDYRLLTYPETDQLVHKEFALEFAQTVVIPKESSLGKFKTTQSTETKERSARLVQQNSSQTESLQADGTESDQNIAPPLEKTKLLSTDGSKTQLSPVYSEAKNSNVNVKCATSVRMKMFGETTLLSLFQQPTSEDLKCSLLSTSDTPEEFSALWPAVKTEQPPLGYSLAYDAEPSRIISQIHDPQYSRETFRSKEGNHQFYGTLLDYNQENSGGAIDDQTNYLSVEMYKRSLSPDSEAQFQPLSPESLMRLEMVRPDSSLSGRSAGSHQALTLDSPIPQFQTSFTNASILCVRSVSPESSLSDLEIEFGLNILFFEDRPSSPDSVSSVSANKTRSIDSPVLSFEMFSPESFIKETSDRSSLNDSVYPADEYGCVSLATIPFENRPPFLNSVDENEPHSHESPVPEFGQSSSETHLTLWERSFSPVSMCSDAEFSSASMESLYGESWPSSVDSVDRNYPLSTESPIPEFGLFLTDFHPQTTLQGSVFTVSSSSDMHYGSASLESLFGESPSMCSFEEDRSFSNESPIPEFEQVVQDYDLSAQGRYSSPVSVKSDIEYGCISLELLFNASRSSSVDFVNETYLLLPESPIPEFSQVLLDPHVSTILDGCLSPVSVASDMQSRSVSLESLFGESRPPSVDSMDESGPLSHESPIAELGEILVESDLTSLEGHSSPVSAMSEIEFGFVSITSAFNESRQSSAKKSCPVSLDPCIPEFEHTLVKVNMNTQQRSLSPSSVLSDLDCVMSDIEYAQSDVDLSISEQRPDSPESQASEIMVIVQTNTSTYLKEIRVPVYRLVFDAELWKLISQIRDPQYSGETFFSKTGVFEYVGTRTEYFPESPVVRTSELEDNIRSGNVELESRSLSLLEMTTNVKTSDSNLCLDSQGPRFSFQHLNISQSLLDSPASTVSDEDSEHCMLTIFSGSTHQSMISATSVDDRSAISHDSPFPDFPDFRPESVTAYSIPIPEGECQTLLLDSTVSQFKAEETERFPSFVGFRSESPPPVPSHLECAHLISISRQTEDISNAFESKAKLQKRPLSSDSESECRSISPVSLTFIFKSTSPESVGSPNEFRALSPDSPIPEFRKVLQESINRYCELRSSSPESVSSDLDVKMNWGVTWFEEQCLSPDSIALGSEYKSLPADSPVPDFRQLFSVAHVDYSCYRASSPESNHSDLDFSPFISQLFEDEVKERPNSPESNLSLHEYQHLSPDSPIPQYTHREENTLICGSASPVYSDEELEIEFCESQLIEDRGTSSGSSAESEFRPDSPIPDFTQGLQESFNSHLALRFSSLTSLSSDEETNLELDVFMPCLFEDRAVTPGSSISQEELRPDSRIPEFTFNHAEICHMNVMFSSSESLASDKNLEIDLCTTWLFEDRATSPGSTTSKEEFDALSPDSPILTLTQIPEKSTVSLFVSRSTSPESVYSDLEMELSSSLMTDDCPLLPQSQYGLLSPDSPVPDFTLDFTDSHHKIRYNRSSSIESEASESEYAPLISQTFDFEDSVEFCPSGQSDDELRCLSPNSPLPLHPIALSSNVRVRYRSTSPEFEFLEEDVKTDLCMTWLFGVRAESPCSRISKEELRPLSPDSPIPIFRQQDSIIPNLELRSTSPESVFSDLEMPSEFPSLTESRPSSPKSSTSIRLSPDSPLPDLVQPVFELPKAIFRSRSISPESTCSEVEYIVLSLGSLLYDNRQSSPSSGASGDENQARSPDLLRSDYKEAMREHVIVNVGYRSPSPESIESDVENALGELLIAMGFGVEHRKDSLLSIESQIQDRSFSTESIPDFKSMSPDELMSLRSNRSESPESIEENTRLSPDSALPSFTQNVLETVIQETYTRASSPESLLSDTAYYLVNYSFDKGLEDKRTVSPQSERSDIESPVPDFTQTFAESAVIVTSYPSIEFSYSDEMSQLSIPFYAEARTYTLESLESEKEEHLAPKSSLVETSDHSVSETSVEPLPPATVPQYSLFYGAELWKLISQVRDPQYAGETFINKTAFVQFICNKDTYERNVTNDQQDNRIKNKNDKDRSSLLTHSEVTHQFSSTETKRAMNTQLTESPLPVIEHILSGTALYKQLDIESTETQLWCNPMLSTSVSGNKSDHLYRSPECLSPNLPEVEDARVSPESAKSVSKFGPISPDATLPELRLALSECVRNLRTTSSPKSKASDLDLLQLNSDILECRPSPPESALFENQDESHRPLSSQSQSRVSFQLAMSDQRPSSPETVSEWVQNRSLSPDSPIPQFALVPMKHLILGPSSDSESSDSADMTDGNTSRPSSPESISSINEFSWLFPDSPVPEFMRILTSCFMDPTSYDRSPSPVSLSSDSEFVALPIDCWTDDNPRPLSPASLESEKKFWFDDELSSEVSPHTWGETSSLQPEQSLSFPQTKLVTVSLIKSAKENCPHLQQMTESKSKFWICKEDIFHNSKADENAREYLSPKPSTAKDAKQKETKTQQKSGEELQSKPAHHRVRHRA